MINILLETVFLLSWELSGKNQTQIEKHKTPQIID